MSNIQKAMVAVGGMGGHNDVSIEDDTGCSILKPSWHEITVQTVPNMHTYVFV